MKLLPHIRKEYPIKVENDIFNVKVEESFDSIDKYIQQNKKNFCSFHFFTRVDKHLI